MRVRDGYLFKRQSASSQSNQQPDSSVNPQIIQNVQQNGEKNINLGQASNFRIGDDYYQSGSTQK
jgi:hypothetical protein